LGYIRRRKREKNTKETKEESPSMARVAQVIEKVQELSYYRLEAEARNPHFLWKWAVVEATLLDKNFLLVRK
jgi:uncharacterized protein (DUF2384 family)